MDKKNLKTLKKICDHISTIENYCDDLSSLEQFEHDTKTADAVILQIIQIGELAKYSLSDSTKEQFKYIPWKSINGMRNRVVHGYDVINYSIVWETITCDLPELKSKLEMIIHDFQND